MFTLKHYGVGDSEDGLVAIGKGVSFKDFFRELMRYRDLADSGYSTYEIKEGKYTELLTEGKVKVI